MVRRQQREIIFSSKAAKQYQEWGSSQPRLAEKVDALLESILKDPRTGIGKPERLRYEFAEIWSRRINVRDRLIYQFTNDQIFVIQLKDHYKG